MRNGCENIGRSQYRATVVQERINLTKMNKININFMIHRPLELVKIHRGTLRWFKFQLRRRRSTTITILCSKCLNKLILLANINLFRQLCLNRSNVIFFWFNTVSDFISFQNYSFKPFLKNYKIYCKHVRGCHQKSRKRIIVTSLGGNWARCLIEQSAQSLLTD